jgi:hypothetical protein
MVKQKMVSILPTITDNIIKELGIQTVEKPQQLPTIMLFGVEIDRFVVLSSVILFLAICALFYVFKVVPNTIEIVWGLFFMLLLYQLKYSDSMVQSLDVERNILVGVEQSNMLIFGSLVFIYVFKNDKIPPLLIPISLMLCITIAIQMPSNIDKYVIRNVRVVKQFMLNCSLATLVYCFFMAYFYDTVKSRFA